MKKANISELKDRLSHYVDRVKHGETIVVMERNQPVARIVPLSDPGTIGAREMESRLRHLASLGVILIGKRRGVPSLLKPPPGRKPTGVADALIEDRRKR